MYATSIDDFEDQLRRLGTAIVSPVRISSYIDTINEAYTSKTCPRDGQRTKPKGRVFTCHVCGFRCARDIVGAANILSRHRCGEVGRVMPPPHTMYRYPFVRRGKRSRLDTAHVARTEGMAPSREAARL